MVGDNAGGDLEERIILFCFERNEGIPGLEPPTEANSYATFLTTNLTDYIQFCEGSVDEAIVQKFEPIVEKSVAETTAREGIYDKNTVLPIFVASARHASLRKSLSEGIPLRVIHYGRSEDECWERLELAADDFLRDLAAKTGAQHFLMVYVDPNAAADQQVAHEYVPLESLETWSVPSNSKPKSRRFTADALRDLISRRYFNDLVESSHYTKQGMFMDSRFRFLTFVDDLEEAAALKPIAEEACEVLQRATDNSAGQVKIANTYVAMLVAKYCGDEKFHRQLRKQLEQEGQNLF